MTVVLNVLKFTLDFFHFYATFWLIFDPFCINLHIVFFTLFVFYFYLSIFLNTAAYLILFFFFLLNFFVSNASPSFCAH